VYAPPPTDVRLPLDCRQADGWLSPQCRLSPPLPKAAGGLVSRRLRDRRERQHLGLPAATYLLLPPRERRKLRRSSKRRGEELTIQSFQ